MPVNANIYMHDLDRTTLDALKAIPGFTQLLKSFMKIWNEQQFHIQNMSTNLRLSEKQLPKYYNMLPPICEKLGIDVSDLYLTLDVVPNAYTYGDTKPFIVLTSGLLETMPEYLIPTVIAHECGHIACHHTLYTTMGRMILNGAISFLGLSELATFPIQAAFYYWMRCSEYSADRAAAICDGTSDNVVEMCMRFSGYDKDVGGEGNVEAFMEQAAEYRQLVNDSKWNKTLEFIMFNQIDHPLNAVRAYECNEWQKSEVFSKINDYLTHDEAIRSGLLTDSQVTREVPVNEAAKYYIGQNYIDVHSQFQHMGFTNITLNRVMEPMKTARSGQVLAISIDGNGNFARGSWYSPDAPVSIMYYEPATDDEIAAQHPGEARTPDSSRRCMGRYYQQVANEFLDAGFTTVLVEGNPNLRKGWLDKEGSVAWISVAGQPQFERGTWFNKDAVVRITYHTFGPIAPAAPFGCPPADI